MISLKRFCLRCVAAAAFALACLPLAATADELWYPYDSNLGADGYDVVAYFEVADAVRGSERFVAEHGGTRWLFSSEHNLAAFEAEPARYVPQYGGYCAFAMGLGLDEYGSPEEWAVHDGRLFFNANAFAGFMWGLGQRTLIDRADSKWPEIAAEAKQQ